MTGIPVNTAPPLLLVFILFMIFGAFTSGMGAKGYSEADPLQPAKSKTIRGLFGLPDRGEWGTPPVALALQYSLHQRRWHVAPCSLPSPRPSLWYTACLTGVGGTCDWCLNLYCTLYSKSC